MPHVGEARGYRVTHGGASVAYVSDHQQPTSGAHLADGIFGLCHDVDLLIHDAQYTPAEFAAKSTWGHCTVEYAVWLAAEVGARKLALYHHDPTHDDDTIDRLAAGAAACGKAMGVEVFAAREGLTVRSARTDHGGRRRSARRHRAGRRVRRRGSVEDGRRDDVGRPGPRARGAARRSRRRSRASSWCVGALLIADIGGPLPALAAAVLLVAFSVTIARQLVDGRHPPCACFGAWSQRPLGEGHLVRNAALLVLALLALF